MQLEQSLYSESGRERKYNLMDLEYLSVTTLYSSSGPLGPSIPSRQLRGPRPLSFGTLNLSSQFNFLERGGGQEETGFQKIMRETEERRQEGIRQEEERKQEEEREKQKMEELQRYYIEQEERLQEGTKKSEPLGPYKFGLTIRDFSASGFQLHIHEGEGGSANIKPYGESKGIPISGYAAAMADLFADHLDIRKILRGIKLDDDEK